MLEADSLAELIWSANHRRPGRFDLAAMACRADFWAVQARAAVRPATVAARRLRGRLAQAAEIGAAIFGVLVMAGCAFTVWGD